MTAAVSLLNICWNLYSIAWYNAWKLVTALESGSNRYEILRDHSGHLVWDFLQGWPNVSLIRISSVIDSLIFSSLFLSWDESRGFLRPCAMDHWDWLSFLQLKKLVLIYPLFSSKPCWRSDRCCRWDNLIYFTLSIQKCDQNIRAKHPMILLVEVRVSSHIIPIDLIPHKLKFHRKACRDFLENPPMPLSLSFVRLTLGDTVRTGCGFRQHRNVRTYRPTPFRSV